MAKKGNNIDEQMMYNTFNMGIGMVLAVDPEDVDAAMKAIRSTGDTPYVIGHIENGEKRSTVMLRLAVLVSGGGTNSRCDSGCD